MKMKRTYYRIVVSLLLVLLSLGYASYYDSTQSALTRLKIKNYTLTDPRIPASFEGLRLVYISDLHIFSQADTSYIEKVFKALQDSHPDFLLIGGDLIDASVASTITPQQIQWVIDQLNFIDAPLGKFAVLGDDDRKLLDILHTIYDQSTLEILGNQSVLLRNQTDAAIRLIGLDPLDSYRDDQMYANEALYTLSFTYSPSIIETLSSSQTSLLLAGKTHGGQVYVPFMGASYSKATGPYIVGTYTVSGIRMDVSSGIATLETQARWLNDPSFSVYTFKTK